MHSHSLDKSVTSKREVVEEYRNAMGNIASVLFTEKKQAKKNSGIRNMFKYMYICIYIYTNTHIKCLSNVMYNKYAYLANNEKAITV